MSSVYLNAEQRKSRILSYIQKHPLCTIREIADNYRIHESRFRLVKTDVTNLFTENKIGKVFNSRECYFLNPSEGKEIEFLVQIMKSGKIFQNRFKKMSVSVSTRYGWPPPFREIVETCISLLYLKLKISLIENRKKTRKNLNIKQLKRFQKRHHSKFIKFLQDYSFNKYSVLGPAISRRGDRGFVEIKNPTQKQRYVYLSNYLSARYHNDERYYKLLHSGSKSLSEKLGMISIWLRTGSIRNVSDMYGRTNKNTRKILGPILKDGTFSFFQTIMPLLAEEGRTLIPEFSSTNLTKVFFESIVRSNASSLKTVKGRSMLSANSKKFFGFDILKQVDWKSFDIS
jgi:hypothetical protein